MRRIVAAVAVLSFATPLPAQRAAPPTWRLVEEWRVGGDVDGAHSFLDVRGLELLPTGGLAVLEFKDQQIHFLDGRGRPVRTVGRMGAGPGEFQNANGFVVLQNSNLVVNDPDNNRFTVLGPTGDFLKSIPVSASRSFGGTWDAWADPRGRVGERIMVRRGEERIGARQIWSADFSRSDTLLGAVCPAGPVVPAEARSYSFRSAQGGMMMMIPFVSPRKPVIHTADGGTWQTEWPTFAAITYTPPGRCIPSVTIPLSGNRVAIPAAVRDSAVARVTTAAARYGPTAPDVEKIPRMYPAFDGIQLDRTGRLWVWRWSDATLMRFDVYGPDGDMVATLAGPPSLEPLRPMVITNDRVYGFVVDADGLTHLVAYRIQR